MGADILPFRRPDDPAEPSPLVDLLAERAVLASCLLAQEPDPERPDGLRWSRWAYDAAAALLGPGDFHDPSHALVFAAMAAIVGREEPLDLVTLAAELTRMRRINAIGGVQFLGDLTDFLPTPAHVDTHIALVATRASSRRMRDAARRFADELDRGSDPWELRDRLVGMLTSTDAPQGRELDLGTIVDEYLAGWERAGAEGTSSDGAVPTGIPCFDSLVRLRPGKLTMLGALPGVGKSALALQASLSIAASLGTVLFVTAEMGPTEIMQRALAVLSGVDYSRIQRSTFTIPESQQVMAAMHTLRALPLRIEEVRSRQFTEAAGAIVRHARRERVRLVVIDHLHELHTRGHASRREGIEWIVSQVKSLARQTDVPFLMLGALNRNMGADKLYREPRASDFRESAMIESVADTVVLLHWEYQHRTQRYAEHELPPRHDRRVIVPKNRGGATGEETITFQPTQQRFFDPRQPPSAPMDAYDDFPRGADDGY